MKTTIITTVLSLFISVLTSAQTVYVNYVSHNEDSYTYLLNQNIYMDARDGIISFANDCESKGAKWSIGSDYVFLQAVANYDTGTVVQNTNNKNLLLWLHDDKNVECDPHSHESAYNYADIAYLHTVLGVTPSSVRSGFIYNSADGHGATWMDNQDPIQGDSFPSFSWQPEVLWGAATMGHVNDPEYYGMWKPTDTTDFFIHNSSNHLINYGGGCKIVASDNSVEEILTTIDNLINKIDSNIIPQSGFYCMSIFFEESNLKQPPFLLKLSELTDSINTRVTNGKMEWKHIEDVVQSWKTDYLEEPFYISCDMDDVYLNIEKNKIISEFDIFPNPANNQLVINKIEILDITGKVVKQLTMNNEQLTIDISNLQNGVYFIKLNDIETLKFIKK